MTSQGYYSLLESKLKANPFMLSGKGLGGAAVGLAVEGSAGWSLVVDQSGRAMVKLGIEPRAGCVISLSEETFGKMVTGKLNVKWAVFTRKIKIKGDKDLAEKVGTVLKGLI